MAAVLDDYRCCRLVIKKHLKKNVSLTVDDEKSFISSNKCWIFGGFLVHRDNKVRHHDHVTGKYRGSVH